MFWAIMIALATGAGDDLVPRMEILREHYDRLGAITVRPEMAQERAQKLADLGEVLKKGAASVEEFNNLYTQMDVVRDWLLANSKDKPQLPPGTFEDKETVWEIKTPSLEVSLDKANLTLNCRTAAREWKTLQGEREVELEKANCALAAAGTKKAEPFTTGYGVGFILNLTDFPEAPGLAFAITFNCIGPDLVIEIASPGNAPLRQLEWPGPFETGGSSADFAVIPHMQGMLLPGDYPKAINQCDLANSRSLYMPWWGVYREGQGILTILETSDDAGGEYHHPKGGPTRIWPVWYSSLGSLRYTRVVRLAFFDKDAGYVAMAKRYRRHVIESGRFVSLAEKRVRTPGLDEVVGRPVIHLGALYHFVRTAALFNKEKIENNHALVTFDTLSKQLRDIKASGIDDAYVHLDGWGFYGYDNGHPDVLPVGEEQGGWEGLRNFAKTCEELGYLFATHDQYRDFYLNAASFNERLPLRRADGSRPYEATWCGGPQTILSAWFAPEYVRRNHSLFAANGVSVKGAYLDVFSVVPPEESFDSAHPMSRSECTEKRRQCFEILKARGYVVSSEEPTDYLVRTLHLVHHGPYPTLPHIGGGEASGIPVPLFNLVYHDSILTPWDMGEDGGWGIPTGDAGRLHCVLNAGLPYAGPGASPEAVTRIKEAAALAGRCAMQEMTNHEIIEGNPRKQRATFADGTKVTVDFGSKEYQIEYPKAR